jgi:hypothetical protein
LESAARAEHVAEIAEANRKQRLERSAEIERKTREIELRDLRSKVTQHGWWQKSVENAARNTIAYQQRATLLNELETALTPPPLPESERDIVYVSEDEGSPDLGSRDFNPALFNKKPRRWW